MVEYFAINAGLQTSQLYLMQHYGYRNSDVSGSIISAYLITCTIPCDVKMACVVNGSVLGVKLHSVRSRVVQKEVGIVRRRITSVDVQPIAVYNGGVYIVQVTGM